MCAKSDVVHVVMAQLQHFVATIGKERLFNVQESSKPFFILPF
jgi:hypothetical protein